MTGSSTITVKFDKSHITSIGERMYTQSLDLIRELAANAYDADATDVKIKILDNSIIVEDNGTGMDREGIEQYFIIGSTYKKLNPMSPIYKRARIGEFGIGKFAVLSLCSRFELHTISAEYSATVIFDKHDFENKNDWTVPIVEHSVDKTKPTGSRVTLYGVTKRLSEYDLERYLINVFPLTDKHFSISINDKLLEPKYIAGERYKIYESTPYGSIRGEVVIASLILPKELVGIGIRVKGVLVRRELFGLQHTSYSGGRRMTGDVQADFLPIATDRNDFVRDSKEFTMFHAIMEKKVRKVVKQLEKQRVSYQDKKSEKVLSDVLYMIKQALKKNREILVMGDLPLFSRKKKATMLSKEVSDGVVGIALTGNRTRKTKNQEENNFGKMVKEAVKLLKPKMRKRVKTLLRDERRIIKKITFGGAELLVSFAHLGKDERESFVDGGIIFVNRDYPLYKNVERKSEIVFYHLIRIISQEIIKLTYPKNIDIGFEWQAKLISDAYIGGENKEQQ